MRTIRLRAKWALLFAGVACGTPRRPEPVTIAGLWEGMFLSGSSRHLMRVLIRQDSAGVKGTVDPRADHGLFVSSGGEAWLDERPAEGWIKDMPGWVVARTNRK